MPRISHIVFTWNNKTKTAVTQASKCFSKEIFGSSEFNLEGKGGGIARFALCEESKDNTGKIIAWNYRPTSDTLEAIPQLAGYKVIILNN